MDEGGRQRPPPGPIYAATVVFMQGETDVRRVAGDYKPEDHVSIVLKYPGDASTEHAGEVEFDFLARTGEGPAVPSASLVVMDGLGLSLTDPYLEMIAAKVEATRASPDAAGLRLRERDCGQPGREVRPAGGWIPKGLGRGGGVT